MLHLGWTVLTVREEDEVLQLERRGGEVAEAEALREQEAREPPGDRVRQEVALQRRERGPRCRLVRPRHYNRRRHLLRSRRSAALDLDWTFLDWCVIQ
jgi:hypothetical protein